MWVAMMMLCCSVIMLSTGEHVDFHQEFQLRDNDDNNLINATEFRQMFAAKGYQLTAEEAEKFTREADTDHDGQLDYKEFVKMMSEG